ncbi:MAG TPA: LacI family DNA-binding transcriptional regulator [Streptosporangiaceae bacterium]|nr:LacI family DNA-binding transcriptional regulator [Streptosporangiaceae bacterium]
MARPPLGRGPTIVDVARAAEVSVSTVSRVVRDHPDVGEQTRARVHEAIDRLGYRPSPIARALVSGQTRLLALLVSDIANPFYPQLAKSVEQAAKHDDYTVIICNTEDRTAETRRYVERLLRQGLDGVIHASAARDEKVLLSLMEDPRRVVFTNRRPSSDSVSYVVSDNRGGAVELTRHLLSLGHRRIGFIGGPSFARNATERLDGFTAAMAEVPDAVPLIAQGDFAVDDGGRAVHAWMDAMSGPTAIIAINDSVALGALEALTARRLRVPQDVALAGFDGVQLAASRVIDLTTVDQHIEQMGRLAVRILLRQLADSASALPTREILPTELLLRGSTEGATGTWPGAHEATAGATAPR